MISWRRAAPGEGMSFRDPTDALRAKAGALESELAEKQREIEAKDREIEELRAAQLSPPPEDLGTPKEPPVTRATERGLIARFREWAEDNALPTVGATLGVGGMLVASFAVYQAVSTPEPARAPASAPALDMPAPTERQGSVTSVEGQPEVSLGDTCSVQVASHDDPQVNCHVAVRCGTVALYGELGNTGFLHCNVDANKNPTGGLDDRRSALDRDPELTLDLTHGRVEVRDGEGPAAWGVIISLEDTPIPLPPR